ncbi:unnamed protein product [Caenorhabditis auriculariae]|uniref:Follistatin-like domain-containing protein n=1 Tax=Caenorhabditis auriculariae TaxID=2777116 RepID=A0A8S1H893_9PELO|nr:unnamed protein product [Caenorhabditis auriculariae]
MIQYLAALIVISSALSLPPPQDSGASEKCGPNEKFFDCGTPCEKTCEKPEPLFCNAMCVRGCQCDFGFLRNKDRKCVAAAECNQNGTSHAGPSCELVDCKSGYICQMDNGAAKCVPQPTLSCASTLCANAHRCEDTPTGPKCVPIEKNNDPKITCANVRCAGGECQMVTNPCNGTDCRFTPRCVTENACAATTCAVGSQCVLVQVQCFAPPCPPIAQCLNLNESSDKCKENEVFSECHNSCSEPKCFPQNRMACPMVCSTGCSCAEGFFRDFEGRCVPQSECRQDPNHGCALMRCTAETRCIDNPDGTGSCVPLDKLPGGVCKLNEERRECGTACEPSCKNPSPQICTLQCLVNVCQCSAGFYRSESGSCVTLDQCNSTAPAFPDCSNATCPAGTSCQQVMVNCFAPPCESPLIQCLPDVSPAPVDPSNDTCGPNENFTECYNRCAEKKCPIPGIEANRLCPASCTRGCACQPGFYRNVHQKCVSEKECSTLSSPPDNCPINETLSDCFNSCSEPKCSFLTSNETVCLEVCGHGCTCRPGFVRNQTGSCILDKECVEKPVLEHQCKKKEVFSDCASKCSEPKCGDVKQRGFCPLSCTAGCTCAEGLVRSGDGECYEPEKCPKLCKKNEVWGCKGCEATCENPDAVCGDTCTAGCQCANGFARSNGKCVFFEDCPTTKVQNITCLGTEVYTDCMPSCERTCHGVDTCKMNPETGGADVCKPGCLCKHGYRRSATGVCTHQRLCFKKATCETNEEWSKCMPQEESCEHLRFLNETSTSLLEDTLAPVPLQYQGGCFSGCACVDGYARTDHGTCIPAQNCP